MGNTEVIKVVVTSPTGQLYNSQAIAVFVKGVEGELGLYKGHAQLLTKLAPSAIRIQVSEEEEKIFYVSGGIIEVQPDQITILADVANRACDINEAAAKEARTAAENILVSKDKIDYSKTRQALMESLAKLRVLELMRRAKKKF
ncbi:MAG: F0F1 ATP synthase subunit epsilon [Thiotrichales bacterium]|nr:MAG: F0F1 ATP synthase subunit epsilon [Thiotrichales bacterium]